MFFEVMKQSIFFPYFGALCFLAGDVPQNGELLTVLTVKTTCSLV